MRGLERLRQAGVEITACVPHRGFHYPLRTEARAWAEILDHRHKHGIPVSMEEREEAHEAFRQLRGEEIPE